MRPLWAIQFELIAQLDREPELRQAFAAVTGQARLGLAEIFHRLDPAADEPTALALGSFHQALLGGMAAQWLVDPETAPSAQELTRALRTVAGEFTGPPSGRPGEA
ncbi:hypothetical protein [Micromonospora soli]